MIQTLIKTLQADTDKYYSKVDPGHNWNNHILGVIERTLDIMSDRNMSERSKVLGVIAAAYHDVGLTIDRATHHMMSAEIFIHDMIGGAGVFEDILLSQAEVKMITTAIRSHRASVTNTDTLDELSKILADADSMNSAREIVLMACRYRSDMSDIETIKGVRHHMQDKYAPTGYLKFHTPEADKYMTPIRKKLGDYTLEDIREIYLSDKK